MSVNQDSEPLERSCRQTGAQDQRGRDVGFVPPSHPLLTGLWDLSSAQGLAHLCYFPRM